MDGARPAGCFSLDRALSPLPDFSDQVSDDEDVADFDPDGDTDVVEQDEGQGRAQTLWMPWKCDLVCSAEHLSREACEDGTGTPVYRLPPPTPTPPPTTA